MWISLSSLSNKQKTPELKTKLISIKHTRLLPPAIIWMSMRFVVFFLDVSWCLVLFCQSVFVLFMLIFRSSFIFATLRVRSCYTTPPARSRALCTDYLTPLHFARNNYRGVNSCQHCMLFAGNRCWTCLPLSDTLDHSLPSIHYSWSTTLDPTLDRSYTSHQHETHTKHKLCLVFGVQELFGNPKSAWRL